MKIVYLSYTYWPPDFGGELLLSIERFQSLARRGHQIIVLTSGKPGLPSLEERGGIRIARSPAVHSSKLGRLMRRPVYCLWALSTVHRLECDVVHFGSMPGISKLTNSIIGWVFAQMLASKNITSVFVNSTPHSEDQPLELAGVSGAWLRRFMRAVTLLVSVSPALHEATVDAFPDHRTVLLLNGVRDDVFAPVDERTRQHVRSALSLDADDVVFTFLGSVGYHKGFDLLAHAFANLSQEHPNWKLMVIGPRSRKESQNASIEEVRAMTEPLEGNLQAIYMGRINDRQYLAKLMASSDVFVLPSRREGMPLAPMEAMSAGVPVIIARLPGSTDQANVHGVTGFYVPPDDASELQCAMQTLGENRQLREAMGQKARERIVETFGWQQHIDRWERLYCNAK